MNAAPTLATGIICIFDRVTAGKALQVCFSSSNIYFFGKERYGFNITCFLCYRLIVKFKSCRRLGFSVIRCSNMRHLLTVYKL